MLEDDIEAAVDDDLGAMVDDHHGRIFEALPPLASSEYRTLLREASREELPPEVLARCYVELRNAKQEDAAEATLRRLLDPDDTHGYLKPLFQRARQRVRHGRRDVEASDLVAIALPRIVERLGRGQAEVAARSWRTFCYYCVGDAIRTVFGRKGQRVEEGTVPIDTEPETQDWASSPLAASVGTPDRIIQPADPYEEIVTFLHEIIQTWPDPLERAVAQNRLDPDPAQTTGSRGSKPPLTEQLSIDRFRIMRANTRVEVKLKAAILARFGADTVRRLFGRDLGRGRETTIRTNALEDTRQ